jgi:serine/threonine-protein kinase
LGIVLYEAACGRLPFDGETPVAVALKQVNEQAQRPSKFNSAIDPRLEEIIGRAMAKDPRARYAIADEMRADLLRITDGSSSLDATTVLPGSPSAVGPNDATTVLPGPDGSGTTVMPAVGGQAGTYEGVDGTQFGTGGSLTKK